MKKVRYTVAAVACVALGALLGPSFATGAIEKLEEVVVRNSESEPVPTRQIGTAEVSLAGTPVQLTYVFFFDKAGQTIDVSEAYLVPEGKRLRVQHVGFNDRGASVGIEQLILRVRENGEEFYHHITTTPQGDDFDAATHQVTAYAGPGARVDFILWLTQPVDQPLGNLWVMSGVFAGVLTDA